MTQQKINLGWYKIMNIEFTEKPAWPSVHFNCSPCRGTTKGPDMEETKIDHQRVCIFEDTVLQGFGIMLYDDKCCLVKLEPLADSILVDNGGGPRNRTGAEDSPIRLPLLQICDTGNADFVAAFTADGTLKRIREIREGEYYLTAKNGKIAFREMPVPTPCFDEPEETTSSEFVAVWSQDTDTGLWCIRKEPRANFESVEVNEAITIDLAKCTYNPATEQLRLQTTSGESKTFDIGIGGTPEPIFFGDNIDGDGSSDDPYNVYGLFVPITEQRIKDKQVPVFFNDNSNYEDITPVDVSGLVPSEATHLVVRAWAKIAESTGISFVTIQGKSPIPLAEANVTLDGSTVVKDSNINTAILPIEADRTVQVNIYKQGVAFAWNATITAIAYIK